MSKALETIERLLKEAEENRAEIERLKSALARAKERADAAEARLRRYEERDAQAFWDKVL